MSRSGGRTVGVGGLVAVLALVCLGWALWATASADSGGGEGTRTGAGRTEDTRAGDPRAGDSRAAGVKVPCREALRFADQERLPSGAKGAACVMRHGIDTQYDIRFRIGRTDLDTWLAATYPDLELRTGCAQEDADRCGVLTLDPYADGGAVAVELTVRDEADGRTLVHYRPFDT
ncbi:hypothetical protein [Streptomyces ortus]|uniref:DUF4333 domain-containing protein n=1 Tax=Streptomyces ortus TaxID=2867268 RepID=A0ABT3UVN3_9ACTN|nr:hypothetical protein [Streptomyces ortus]MCX4231632.1 hypothetical protein [Streptomyces ortus]